MEGRRVTPHLRFRPGTMDRAIFTAVFTENEYRLPPRFAPTDVIVDVGGHIGSRRDDIEGIGVGTEVHVAVVGAGDDVRRTDEVEQVGEAGRNMVLARADDQLQFAKRPQQTNIVAKKVTIVALPGAGEHADCLSLPDVTSRFERLPGAFQHEALLRIGGGGFRSPLSS